MRRFVTAVTVVLGLVMIPQPASASAPERTTFSFQNSDTINCSVFDPAWRFDDNFTDFFDIRRQTYRDTNGDITSFTDHVVQRSNDVNSVTGFTLHEHNHFTVTVDFVAGTVTLSGGINIAQRRGLGSVILRAGHKVFDLATGDPILLAGPDRADDEDFCRAVAPLPG